MFVILYDHHILLVLNEYLYYTTLLE